MQAAFTRKPHQGITLSAWYARKGRRRLNDYFQKLVKVPLEDETDFVGAYQVPLA